MHRILQVIRSWKLSLSATKILTIFLILLKMFEVFSMFFFELFSSFEVEVGKLTGNSLKISSSCKRIVFLSILCNPSATITNNPVRGDLLNECWFSSGMLRSNHFVINLIGKWKATERVLYAAPFSPRSFLHELEFHHLLLDCYYTLICVNALLYTSVIVEKKGHSKHVLVLGKRRTKYSTSLNIETLHIYSK